MTKELQFLLYSTQAEDIAVSVIVKDDTIWLTQKAMAELFGVKTPAISKHLKSIFETNELEEKVVVSKMEITTRHGFLEGKTQTKGTKFYNLDAIISVGYRVNSSKATQFRIWATSVLTEYMRKGFVLDDERLKQGRGFLQDDPFKELLERVRSIRASERRIWQQLTDIFAECSDDYKKTSAITQKFYATVQNKFHYAITGHTAAEIIYTNADSHKENMGLTTWKNSPDGRILKSDVTIAKNYLTEKEIKSLERTVSSFFDYIEGIIERKQSFTMEKFALSVNKFLEFNEYKILEGKGNTSKKQADAKAAEEYDQFNKTQKITSDFDAFSKEVLERRKKGA
ncbi:MAG: virulence RhuM family protein [Pseudomonadota bacterium]